MWNLIPNDRLFLDTKIAYITIKRYEDVADNEIVKELKKMKLLHLLSSYLWIRIKMSKPFQTSIGHFSVVFHQFVLDKLFDYHPMLLCKFKHKQVKCEGNCTEYLQSHGILRTISQRDACWGFLANSTYQQQLWRNRSQHKRQKRPTACSWPPSYSLVTVEEK